MKLSAFPVILVVICQFFGHGSHGIGLRWKWEVWEDVPSSSQLRIFIFNLTNPDEFEAGAKPAFQEIGPYVFRESRRKVATDSADGATVSMVEIKSYEFIRLESIGSEDDLVTIVNIPLLIFGKLLADVTYVGANFFKSLVKSGEKLTRRNERIGDIFYYGFEAQAYIKVLEALQGNEPIPEQFSGGRFGLFKGRNGTDEGIFVVGTGKDPSIPYGKVISWKNETELKWWGDESCNEINGVKGETFDPKSLSKLHLYTFDPDVCRPIQYTYHGRAKFHEVSSWKYVISKDFLEDPRVDPKNLCFCPNPGDNNENCFRKGVIDLAPCRNGAPLVLSYPHFFHADEIYTNQISGMEPNKSLHHSTILIEPKTGTVLQEIKRFQLNIQLKPFSSLTYLKKVQNLLLPIFWSEKVYTLNEKGLTLLKEELKNYPHEEDIDEEGGWKDGALKLENITSIPSTANQLPAYFTQILSAFLFAIRHWRY